MRITIVDLEGERSDYKEVDEVAFSNASSFGWPAAFERKKGTTKVLINAQGYSSLRISDDE